MNDVEKLIFEELARLREETKESREYYAEEIREQMSVHKKDIENIQRTFERALDRQCNTFKKELEKQKKSFEDTTNTLRSRLSSLESLKDKVIGICIFVSTFFTIFWETIKNKFL